MLCLLCFNQCIQTQSISEISLSVFSILNILPTAVLCQKLYGILSSREENILAKRE